MLILSRKSGESIVIDGRIVVKIVRVEGGEVVKVGIQAPIDVPVHRQEVYDEIQRTNQEALTRGQPAVPQLPAASVSRARSKTAASAPLRPTPAGPSHGSKPQQQHPQ
ncbi:MAG: carbon storage regulator CsrA [Verrucomicrobia bacterium]|nr:carbon storage regulator CsrA [Verrucomicrobiota bacterium]